MKGYKATVVRTRPWAYQKIWIDGRCYRFCDSCVWSQGKELQSYVEEFYEPDYYESNDEEERDASIEIVPAGRGDRLKHSFYIINRYLNSIQIYKFNADFCLSL